MNYWAYDAGINLVTRGGGLSTTGDFREAGFAYGFPTEPTMTLTQSLKYDLYVIRLRSGQCWKIAKLSYEVNAVMLIYDTVITS